jgi:heptaprenyl diphosphate synthase
MNIHAMWDQYPEIKQDLADVLKVIDANITLRDKKARKTILNLLHAGGKLLRPAFFLLTAKAGKQYDREQLIHVAASIEVLHMASLIHDDIIDEAETRRGLPTVASQFGQKYALYTGDYLFCVCFKILSKYANALSTIEFNTDTVERILIGELEQMESRYNLEITIKQYLHQISRKTAALFAMSCFIGAELSEGNRQTRMNARKIGHEIGMAFQILDDILDYTGEEGIIGKPTLEDMKQGVYSLPLIYAMNQNREPFIPLLSKKENICQDDVDKILALIKLYDGVEKAQELAVKYSNKAIGRINKMPDCEAKTIMLELTEKLLQRRS